MTNPNFDLLNVLPVTGRKHSNRELALANAGAEHLRTINTFSSELEVVKHIIEYNGLGEAHCALEEALRRSVIYKEWQDSMPFLKDVPNIHKFRNLPKHKININLVNNEIILFGGYLTQGQILYRGGNFQAKDTTIENNPISTSIMPSVARWHAIKVSGEIAMLEVAESNITRAFAFKTKGNQRLKDEYEVLLQNSLRFEYVKTSNHNNMKIHEFKVYAIA